MATMQINWTGLSFLDTVGGAPPVMSWGLVVSILGPFTYSNSANAAIETFLTQLRVR